MVDDKFRASEEARMNVRDWVVDLLNKNSELLADDLRALTPYERWTIVERLLRYVLAMPNTTSVTRDGRETMSLLDNFILNNNDGQSKAS